MNNSKGPAVFASKPASALVVSVCIAEVIVVAEIVVIIPRTRRVLPAIKSRERRNAILYAFTHLDQAGVHWAAGTTVA